MTKISIIVPVYNMETYLKKCMDSLLNQTLNDIEIICVNDGSTDNSLKILEDYAQNDNRVVILNQENKGTGIARNNALKIVKGEYIAFADPDDWIELNAFETLYNFAKKNNSQIVQFNYVEYNEYSKESKNISFNEHIKKEYSYDLSRTPYYNWKDLKDKCLCSLDLHAWSHFYNAEFIKKYSIEFGLNRRAEDHLFTLGAMLVADKTDYLNEYLYFYRCREGSAVNTRGDDNFKVFDNIERLKNFIVRNNLWEELKDEFHYYEKQIMIWHYNQTPFERIKEYEGICRQKLTAKDFKEVMKQAKRKRKFIENIFSLKNKKENGRKYKILTILGLEFVFSPKPKGGS